MKKVKINAPAKINLTLDVLGVKDGYHMLKSLVCSINVCDEIVLKARKDKAINLICDGIAVDCAPLDNNAHKAARLFMEKYNTCGVDIVVTKNIPVGAGLGGSSADIAGVLNGMQKLYPGEYNLFNLANYLGSDSGYMLNGGFAVIEGRGDIVKPVSVAQKMYFIILTAKNGVSARDSYKNFDKLKTKPQSITDKALEYLNNNELEEFLSILKNDLYTSSAKLEPEILSNIYLLKKAGVDCALMTGSGSAVFGLFFDKKERDKVYNKLKPICADAILKAESI